MTTDAGLAGVVEDVPLRVARALGWDGSGDVLAFLTEWRPAPDLLDPWAVVARASCLACAAWVVPAILGRQDTEIVVLAIMVGRVDPLEGPLLRWDLWRKERADVGSWPNGDEMLAGLDLMAATGRAPLLVVFTSDTQSKGVMLGIGPGKEAAA